jgi:hypothetical protein
MDVRESILGKKKRRSETRIGHLFKQNRADGGSVCFSHEEMNFLLSRDVADRIS